MIQGSDEWHAARLGKVTASRAYGIMRGKNGYRASRKDYIAELVCERLTGKPTEFFVSKEMQWGTDTEPLARATYEAVTGSMVQEAGFIEYDGMPGLGASPDGLVGDIGGIEIKCPKTATHIDTLINATIKPEYTYQMQTCMACTNREWWDFVSYDPRMPDKHAIKIIRVDRDELVIAAIIEEAGSVLAEVDQILRRLG